MKSLYRSPAETDYSDEFANEANQLFARGGLAWRFEGGLIQRAMNPQVIQYVNSAQTILSDTRYAGPDEQFAQAILAFNTRPMPNYRGCVTDAVGTIEAVANIIKNTKGRTLTDLLKTEPFQSEIHGTLKNMLGNLYGYRGNASAHGQVGPSDVEIEEAEWVLGLCASTIVYFSKKFPL